MNSRIEEINGSAYQYYTTVLPQFNAICDPLFKFGIKNFGYLKIFKNGQYLNLTNNNDLLRKYMETIKDQGNIWEELISKNIRVNQKSYFSIGGDINSFDPKNDPIAYLIYDHGIWNTFNICKLSDSDFIEFYSFSLDINNSFPLNYYLENRNLLDHFSDYFNEKAKDIINCKNKKKLAIFEQQFNFSNKSEGDILAQNIEQFLLDTKIDRSFIKVNNKEIRLSKRESECLKYLAAHKSIKEIGKVLGISPRTVEYYLLNIKDKTGITKKSELLAQFLNK